MATLKTSGLTEVMKMLEQIGQNTDEIVAKATIAGASVATDEMRKEISNLRTSDQYAGGNGKRYPLKSDIKGLLDSLGFTPVRFNDSIADVNVGFDGYNSSKSKKYPKGHPNRMVANSINKGTSFLIAQPFINRTKRKAQDACIAKMQEELDKEIKKLSK